MIRYLLIVILSLFPVLVQGITKTSVSFSNLSVKDGLSQNTIIRIFQDSKDYMWFCTRDGLNKYDGTTFEIFRNILGDSTSISSSDITTIAETKDGNLWVGTHYGLNRMDPINRKFTRYYPNNRKNSLSDFIIKHLYVDSKNHLWIATTSGLDLYDERQDCFRSIYRGKPIVWLLEDSYGNLCFTDGNNLSFYNYSTRKVTSYSYPDKDEIYHIYEDSKKNLWIGTTYSGLKRFDYVTHQFTSIDLGIHHDVNFNNEQIGYIVEDESRNLLLASRSGILIYNYALNKCLTHIVQTDKIGSISDNTIISLYKDHTENIWVGTWTGGVDYYSPFSNYFQFHVARKDIDKPIYNYNSFAEWNSKIWIGTNSGLIEYTTDEEKFTFYRNMFTNSAKKDEIKYIKPFQGKGLYISIFGGNLFLLQNEKCLTQTLTQYRGAYLRDMEQDSMGNIWLASHTNDLINLFDPKNNLLTNLFSIKNNKVPKQFVNVQDILIDNDSIVWIGTRNNGLYRYNYKTYQLNQYQVKKEEGSLPNNNISVLFKDSYQDIWVGTYGGGICKFDRKTNSFYTFNSANKLNNQAVCGILEDDNTNIWVTTQGGISYLNKSDTTFVNYTHANGLPLQEINMHACMKSSDGTFYIGGSNGFLTFMPQYLKKNPHIPRIVITDFKIWTHTSKDIDPMKFIRLNNEIHLKYNQSQFSISYAALNYVFPHMNQYAYQLEGFDQGWNYVNNVTTANYTNLSPGKYIFHVKGSNNDGIWNENGISFVIIITPPFWATWWAYTLYTLFVSLLVWFIFNYFITKERLENNLRIEKIEQQSQEENHQLRIRLFTNFSHELRTPLTLIIGPLSNLLSDKNIPSSIVGSLNLIEKNANRLLLLVNQLMDFRKLETGNLKLKVSNDDFGKFINEIFIAFQELSKQRNIKLSLNYYVSRPDLWYNSGQLEKVLFNLLSNAFRHTRSNGEISIDVRQWNLNNAINKYGKRFNSLPLNVEQIIEIKVRDTGHGIAAEDLNKIFDPFYQANNYETNSVYGTGIGLNLTKGIIELHRGTIWAESKEGEGSIFRIFLPLGDTHLLEGEKALPSIPSSDSLSTDLLCPDLLSNIESEELSVPKKEPAKRYTILVIEDNQDVRFYIKSLLKNKFGIKEAENGLEGKEMAISYIPDLIICDIMMPGMNGIDVCKTLKEDLRTSHIPIVLLTARTTISQIKEGLLHGADDYITKPFNGELFQTRIENLILNREKLREAFGKRILVETPEGSSDTVNIDEQLFIKVQNYIMANIDNPELSIENLAEEIGMSRTQLYRKIKAITDMSPQKLLLNIRLKVAAICLKDEGLNVSETCARVGFSDPSYFSKRFKAYYNSAPSEFVKEK